MYKLEIKKADDSIYWVDHFRTMSEGQKWIDEEQTSRYWNRSYSNTIVRIGPT